MPPETLPLGSLELAIALETFRLDMLSRRLSPRTLANYRFLLEPFAAFLEAQGVTRLGEIEPGHCRAYLASLQARGLKPATQHSAARSIKAWLSFHVREGDLADSPMRRVRMPKLPQDQPIAFAAEDVKRLVKHAGGRRDRAIVLCLLDTGCRASEFVALSVGDVDPATGAVMVRRGKGGKDRTVYLGVQARKALLRYLATRQSPAPSPSTLGHLPLWVTIRGGRLTREGLRTLLRRLGERAEVEHCHPHTFRRTFALWSLRAGMNIYALRVLMGHADLAMLRRYLALVETDLQDAHRRHGPVDSYL